MTADPNRCPLFVELCAGTAALSLRLHHPRARPPVSRMGAKTGYADVILRCMGLRPGQGSADGTRYLWCEPDKGVRLLLHAYRDRALALAAAQVIRGWADEEPRALWERLRAEGPAVCPPVDAREVARWLWVAQRAYRQGEPQSGGPVQIGDGGRWAQPLEESLPGAPTLPATITADARDIDPREVARAARLLTANRLINLDPETWRNTGEGGTTHGGAEFCTPAAALADAVEGVPEVPGAVVDDARAVDPPKLPPGVVVYIDPPYLNTTGYAHKFRRSEWLPIVRRWAEAGALVVVSEARRILPLLSEGWHAVEITGERKGQKRTFSKQQREWLTMSRPPAWRPSEQMGLF